MKDLLMLCLVAGSMGTAPLYAQEVDPEWPCIQRFIPTLSPAIFWPVYVEDPATVNYKDDADLLALSEQLGDIDELTDQHRQSIQSFAESIPGPEREKKLTELALGILDVSNRIRSDYLTGIKRYTRQQIDIALQIESTLNTLSLMETDTHADNGSSRQELEETLRWHERVYDQRERAIQSLCDSPVELEQRLSQVLREAAQYLP